MNFRNQQHIPSQVFCHSDLEGKCLCAHGRLSQLWCQHFSSSMRQINPSCLSCLTSLKHLDTRHSRKHDTKATEGDLRKQRQKVKCHELQKPATHTSTSQVFCHSDLEGKFLCSWTFVSALVPTLFLINTTDQS